MNDVSKQTQRYLDAYGPVKGDCYRTALACVMGVSRDSVPHFVHRYYDDPDVLRFWWETVKYVENKRLGSTIVCLPGNAEFPLYTDPENDNQFVIASGKSPRGDWNHCVVVSAITGEMVWDVHPSGDGIVDRQEYYALTTKGED